ncbi:MAG: type II toxin-antitoxin system RelE/ParE family toxin [Rhizobiaceae bacterium]
MKVILTEAAWADMLSIGQVIKRDSPARAISFVDELYEHCQELGAMPRAFPLLPDFQASGIRRRVHGNYLIFYRIGDEAIEILHVLNGAMDYEQTLFPDQ